MNASRMRRSIAESGSGSMDCLLLWSRCRWINCAAPKRWMSTPLERWGLERCIQCQYRRFVLEYNIEARTS